MPFDEIALGLGTTTAKLRLGLAGAMGIATATGVYLLLKASGMPGPEAVMQVMMGWWPGTVLIAPLGYDLICKGWSLDHHAEPGGPSSH